MRPRPIALRRGRWPKWRTPVISCSSSVSRRCPPPTRDFLFELGVEEMPSAPLNNAVKQLESLMGKGLDEAGLAHGAIRVISRRCPPPRSTMPSSSLNP